MSKLIRDVNFEPTSSTKELWLFGEKEIRKYPLKSYDDYFFGVFDSKKFKRSRNAFLFSLVIEFATIVILWRYVPSPFVLILPFIFDVVLAYFAQWFEKSICLNSNRAVLAKEELIEDDKLQSNALSKKYYKEYNKNRVFQKSLHFLLLLIVAVKAILIFLYMPGNMWFKIAVFTFNLIACLIHINNTGDFIHGLRLRRNLNEEFKSHSDIKESNSKVKFYRKTIIPGKILKIMEATETFKHKIEDFDENQALCTWGVLEDEDLNDMIETQDTEEQKRLLALYGLRAQIQQILPNDPQQTETVL